MNLVARSSMSADDARRLTERIRLTAHSARDSIEKLHVLVAEAKDGNAHEALGYASWTAYLADVLGEEPLRLARDQRQELVGYLSGEGMSTRAIAPIVGVSKSTVQNWTDETPTRPATVTSLDGRLRPATRPEPPAAVDHATGEVLDQPRTTNRRAITDTARDLGLDLRKLADRMQRFNDDDRRPRNKDAVAAHLRHHLAHAIKVCQDLDATLNKESTK